MVHEVPIAVWSLADQYKLRTLETPQLLSQEAECRKRAEAAMSEFGTLPATRSFETYLIQGVGSSSLEMDSNARVTYPPEFVFVLDVGLESLAGVAVPWTAAGLGDPFFPDFSKSALRSIKSRDRRSLLYPKIAGSIMIGARTDVPDDDVRKALVSSKLRNVQGAKGFWTAECQPFVEQIVCDELEKNSAFIKYAEPNYLVRLGDFLPGWTCVRLN